MEIRIEEQHRACKEDWSCATNLLASITSDYRISIWDADSGKRLNMMKIHFEGYLRPKISRSGDGLMLATCDDFLISIWNLSPEGSLELIGNVNTGDSYIFSLCLNFDGSRILSGHEEGKLCAWNITSGEQLWSRQCVANGRGVLTINIGSHDSYFAYALNDRVILCSGETGEDICQLIGHSDVIRSVILNPDASRMASASADRTIRIWDVANRSQVLVLEGHTGGVSNLSYSPDGTRLASSSSSALSSLGHTVMVWDLESGVCLLVLRGDAPYAIISFSNDSTRIAAGCNKRIIIWDSTSGSKVMQTELLSHWVSGVCYLQTMNEYLLK